jgi:hypothetical protein
MTKFRKYIFPVLVVMALAAVFYFQNTPQVKPPDNTSSAPLENAQVDTGSLGKLETAKRPGSFLIPHVGEFKCAVRTETVEVPCTGGERVKMKLNVYTLPSGDVIRVEFLSAGVPYPKRPHAELERILEYTSEKYHGIGKLPLPRTWNANFTSISSHVDLRKAAEFNITYVDWQKSDYRQNIYICNIYGARGMDGPEENPSENVLRIIINPIEKHMTFDSRL